MTTHFFADAPVLTWFEWLKRYFFNKTERPPSLILSNLSKTNYPISPTGVQPEKAKADLSYEYSNFLSMYFYPPESPLKLIIPSCIIESGIKNAYIHGIEIRDVNRAIVGVIFCIYTGLYEEKSTGLIHGCVYIHLGVKKEFLIVYYVLFILHHNLEVFICFAMMVGYCLLYLQFGLKQKYTEKRIQIVSKV
jgi:hypothetical protein